jgi:hypothetical protein
MSTPFLGKNKNFFELVIEITAKSLFNKDLRVLRK